MSASILESINKAIFDAGFSSYYDYLKTIVNFAEAEKKKTQSKH
jgi:hypothetical protein